MADLRFKPTDVERLIAMSLAAKDWRPSFADHYDKKLRKKGAKPDNHGYVSPENVETTKIGPKLWLVKDEGSYLMSNAAGQQLNSEGKHDVAYADGFGPNCDWSELRAALGGDDFVEALDVAGFVDALKYQPTWIILRVTEESISIVTENRGKPH